MKLRKLRMIIEKLASGEKVSQLDIRWALGFITSLEQKEKTRSVDKSKR
jgi:hypothetical protein